MLADFIFRPDAGLIYFGPEAVVGDDAVIFTPKEPYSPLAAAGAAAGDVIQSVNGLPMEGTLDLVRADAEIRSYGPVVVELRHGGGAARRVVYAPSSRLVHPDWLFLAIPALCLACAAFIMSITAPYRPSVPLLVLAALAALLALCAGPFSHRSVLMNALSNTGGPAAAFAVVSGLYFPRPRGRRLLRLSAAALLLVLGAGFVAARTAVFSAWLSGGREQTMAVYRSLGLAGMGAGALGGAFWAVLAARAYFRSPSKGLRRSIQWMAAAILIALPAFACFQLLPRVMEGTSPGSVLGAFPMLFLAPVPVLVAVGTTRRPPAGPTVPLIRSGITVLLFLLVFAGFSAGFIPVRSALASGYRMSPPAANLLTSAIGFLALAPLALGASAVMDRVLPMGPSRRPAYAAMLERENSRLRRDLSAETEKRREALSREKLADVSAVIRGMASRLREPAAEVSRAVTAAEEWAASGGSGKPPAFDSALAASLTLSDMARAMASLSASPLKLPAVTIPEVLVRTAMEKVKRKLPHARFSAEFLGAGRISCCPEELVDALAAVMENAVEAQEGGTEAVRIRSDCGGGGAVDPGIGSQADRIAILIEDDGMGMTDPEMKRLFHPFSSTKPGHLGLGLYLARLIVEKNGGTLSLVRREAGGMCCSISFPAVGFEETHG